MAALRLAARKLAGVGPRAPTNIQAVIGSSSRPATAAATAIEEGQRRLPALASCCFYPSRRFSSGPRPKFSAFDNYLRHHEGPDPPYVDKAELEALRMEVEQKKEELFYKIALLDWQWESRRRSKEAKMDRDVLCLLVDHVKPNPDDQVWRRSNYIKKVNTGLLIGVSMFTVIYLVALHMHAGG